MSATNKMTVKVLTDTNGSQDVEVQTGLSVWDVCAKINAADPNAVFRFREPGQAPKTLNAEQAKTTPVTKPDTKITQTRADIQAA